jgi:DNA-binding LytR/AlgR family response regulator
MKRIVLHIIFPALIFCSSCGNGKYHDTLLLAEEQVTKSTDSCAILLKKIDADKLSSEDRALHGLVSSWLLYRQYAKEIPEEPLQAAFDYYHDSKNALRRAQVYFLRSVIHQDQKRGQPSEWMEDLYSACLAIEQTDDYLLASQIYQNYSTKLSHARQYDKACIWIDKFVEAARQSGHQGEYVQALIHKSQNCLYAEEARVQKELNTTNGGLVAKHTQFEKAFATIYKAMGIAKDNNLKVALGRIYTQLSIYHSRCQRLDSLLYYAKLSVQTNEQLYAQGFRKDATNYLTLSDAYRKLGQADSAIYYAQKTLTTPGTPLRNKRVAAQLMYNIYADLKGDYKTSLLWMQQFNKLTDSINQAMIAANIEAAQDAAIREQEKSALKEEKQHTMGWLVWSIAAGGMIITAITTRMVRNRRRYHRHLQEQEAEFNRMIEEMHSKTEDTKEQHAIIREACSEPEKIGAPATITLAGNTKENVKVNAASILFLTSDGNYIKVYHLDDEGRVHSKMIRQTMTSIESQLKDHPLIVRCHRAFFVNLQHVKNAASSSSGFLLALDASPERVPVSKTYISLIKAKLVQAKEEQACLPFRVKPRLTVAKLQ